MTPKRIMREFRMDEISGVTRPAQEHAKAVIMKRDETEYWKRDFSQDQRDRMASSGSALPDGSFPISNTSDLKNAIHAIGRAKDPAKAKAHIISRARSLGATDLLPDGWVSKRDLTHDEVTNMDPKELQAKIDDAVAKATTDLTKKLTDATAEVESLKKAAAKKPAADAEDAADGGADEATEDANGKKIKAKKNFDAEVKKAVDAELAKRAEIAKGDETFTSEGVTIRKSEVGEPTFKLLKSQAEKLEMNEFGKIAETTYRTLPGESVAKAKAVRAISKLSKEDREAIEAMLKAGETAMADRLKVIGKGSGAEAGSAQGEIEKRAEAMRTADPKLTKADAIAKVLDTSEGKQLYSKAEAEKATAAKAA